MVSVEDLYHSPTFKYEDAINANFPPQFAIIELAINVLRTWGRVQVDPKRNN